MKTQSRIIRAELWRATFQGALTAFIEDQPTERERLALGLMNGKNLKLWRTLRDGQGKPFPTFEEFCRHPRPQGLGTEPEDVRHMLLRFLPKTQVARETARKTHQGKTSPHHVEKRTDRAQAARRAPKRAQDLHDAGLIGWAEIEKFGAIKKSPKRVKEEASYLKKATAWLAKAKTNPSRRKEIAKMAKTQAKAVFQRHTEPKRYPSAYTSNASAFAAIIAVHGPPPGSKVIDVTFGSGVFWQEIPTTEYEVTRCDLKSGTDLTALPYPDATFEACVLDPPYMHTGRSADTKRGRDLERRYANRARPQKGHKGVIDLYVRGGNEAARVLTKNGILIVKCMPEVESGRQRVSQVEIELHYAALGFYRVEEAIVTTPPRPTSGAWKAQHHFDKNHSYFLVFRRGRSEIWDLVRQLAKDV